MDQYYCQNINLNKIEAIPLTMADVTLDVKTPDVSMAVFLQEIEKKAYHLALLAVGCHADALDLLQDTMIKLVTKYQNRPSNEWKPLFYKILKNKIRDWHRHQKVKNLVFFWKSPQVSEESEQWPETLEFGTDNTNPEHELTKTRQQGLALASLKQLSEKQQQCFLLRSWEGLSVIETAEIMGCSTGSVKTHYFRALNKLRTLMEEDDEIAF